MNGKFLLATNIIIALFAGEESILRNLGTAEEVFISSNAIGELFFGAQKSSRVAENIRRIQEFVGSNTVLNCDAETAQHYGEIKESLRKTGRPIPENDIWIASIARQHDLALATRDQRFQAITLIQVTTW